MNYDDYMAKRCQLFNEREEGFRIIKQAEAKIEELDAQHAGANKLQKFTQNLFTKIGLKKQ